MGDTGSLFLGFMVAIFSIHFMELNKWDAIKNADIQFSSAPVLVYALLIVPLFDTLRVFALRILRKKSPFAADRNHIHHRLIDLNLSHMRSTTILLVINIISFLLAFLLNNQLGNELIFVVVSIFILFSNWILCYRFTKSNKIGKIGHTFPDLAAY
jgi:UDP-N-acetylmuramyl pentapeptide phosphotransferase/UDP-N-acetylglucosamine-1-phosphate transferase